MNAVIHKFVRGGAALFVLFMLASCSGSSSGGGEGTTDESSTSGAFILTNVEPIALQEGNPEGANIPVVLTRIAGHNKPVNIRISGATDADNKLISIGVFPEQIPSGESFSNINLRLAIDDLPIMPQQRIFYLDADDGADTARTTVRINVQPIPAPDVYLLIGQSNMVGFSGDGTKLANAGGPDEPHPRIFQLNVTKNDSEVFADQSDFTDENKNAIVGARIVQAEDPLHIPLDPSNASSKTLSYIGMGMSFAKAALNNTTQNIILVPAAWSGSAFCDNDGGPGGQWNAQETDDPNLGNTWLFDRAVTRTNIALAETGGILRGILWHQGESDSNSRCAGSYLANLERLAQQLRLQIDADRRGGDLRRPDANIPFIAGTMSRGVDERDDLSVFWPEKQTIDDAHKLLPAQIAHAALTINDDLVPANGFPCGNTTCIHFGAAAFREMGQRYFQSLLRAVETP